MVADVGDERGVAAAAAGQHRAQPDADQRRQVGAGDLRRLVDRAILRGQPRQGGLGAHLVEPLLEVRARLDGRRVAVRLERAVEVAARLEQLTDLRERLGVGIERGGLAEVLQRSVRVPLLPFDDGQLAIQKRAVRRAGDRGGVGLRRLVEPAGARGLAGPSDPLLRVAEPEHLDPAGQFGLRRIDGQRRFEGRQRVSVPVERHQRRRPSQECRHVVLLRVEIERAIEMRQRRLGVLPRELEIAEGGFRRIERRQRLQRRRRTPARPS